MKAALITGALGGIGQALCEEFSAAGYRVVATDREHGTVPSGHLIEVDVRDLVSNDDKRAAFLQQVEEALEGASLTVLVNNAAVQLLGSTEEINLAQWRETLDTNLLAPFVLAQMFLPQLSAAGGSVINISSIHATMTKPRFVCYATSKAALVGLTRSMAVDLGPRLRVNAILPAAVSTPMLLEGFIDSHTDLLSLAAKHPLGRIASPSDIAKVAIFLSSDSANFMTGACMQVDGGISGRLNDPK